MKKIQKENLLNLKKFWLEDNSIITKSVFVSASPNKKIAENNLNIFGPLFKHKKVRDLIIEKWLCDIQTKIFEFEIDKGNANIVLSILESFQENQKKWGFSFHNNQKMRSIYFMNITYFTEMEKLKLNYFY